MDDHRAYQEAYLSDHPPGRSITLGMLLDALEPLGIASAPDPAKAPATLRWVACSESADIPEGAGSAPWDVAPEEVAHLCTPAGYLVLRAARPDAFAVVCSPDADARLDDPRCVALRTERPLVYVYLVIRGLMGRMAAWEQTLDALVRDGASVTTALDVSRSVIGGYLFVVDKNGYVMGQSSYLEPPDGFHQAVAASGFAPARQEPAPRHRLAEGEVAAVAGQDPGDRDRLVAPLHHDHSLIGTLSMACPAEGPGAGTRDCLRVLAHAVEALCGRVLPSLTSVNIPRLRFFDLLLQGSRFDRIVAKGQLEELRIPPESWFKLILVDIDEGAEPAKASHIAMAFISEKRMRCRCFLHNGSLLVLQHAARGPELSHLATEKILSSHDLARFDVAFGVSDPFGDIASLRYAYHEARIALDLRKPVMAQRDVEQSPRRKSGAFFFHEAFPFYLVDPEPKDEGLMRFIFDVSFLPSLLEEDATKGTNDFRLLWTYLLNERNATKTAQALFVHRNTVLYRVERIQERFQIDLDDSNIREKLLLDYRMHFLSAQGSRPLVDLR